MADEKSIDFTRKYSKESEIVKKKDSFKQFDKFDLYFNINNPDELNLRTLNKKSRKVTEEFLLTNDLEERENKLDEDEYAFLKGVSVEPENTKFKARAGSILKMLETNIENIRKKTTSL